MAETTKHTPGPWSIEWKGGSYNANGTSCIAWVTAPGTNIADVCYSGDMTNERAEANARLISDSPKLLESLASLELFFARPGEGATAHFDRVAESFHRQTGYLRPGKDCVVDSYEVRKEAWDEWVAGKLSAARALLPLQEKASNDEGETCPACDGAGEVSIPRNSAGQVDFIDGIHNGEVGTCQVCDGTGSA